MTKGPHESGENILYTSHRSPRGGTAGTTGMDAAFIWKLSKLGRIGSSQLHYDDDFADRLNYQWSGFLMFLFIGILGIRQYVGKPIQCWIPQEFTRGWEEYAENYCWVSNTYYSVISKNLPPDQDRQTSLILYYQWAPILLALQALLFYLPCLFWRLTNNYSGFNIRRIMQMASDSNIFVPDSCLRNAHFIARYMEMCIYRQRGYRKYTETNPFKTTDVSSAVPDSFRCNKSCSINVHQFSSRVQASEEEDSCVKKASALNQPPRLDILAHSEELLVPQPKYGCKNSIFERLREKFSRNCSSKILRQNETICDTGNKDFTKAKKMSPCSCRSIRFGRLSGNFLVILYFLIKILYIINIAAQMMLMECFVGTVQAFYGIRVLIDLIRGREWSTTGNFPRVTFCDFEAKKLGKNQRYTIQCVLPLNMFLEKIFVFFWFWHCAVGLITLASFAIWFIRMGFSRQRIKFVRRYLKVMDVIVEADKSTVRSFVENFLCPDGVFIIRLVAVNVGEIIAGDLACELWRIYRLKRSRLLEEQTLSDMSRSLATKKDDQSFSNAANIENLLVSNSSLRRENAFLSMHNGIDDSIV